MIFRNENLEYLIRTGEHCIHEDYYIYLNGSEIKKTEQTTKNRYKIGIIIPNYNGAEWLDKCLKSVECQTYKNYEVIFIDDMSTDNSIEIAKKYIDKINIKIVELKQKRYNGGARNEGYLYLSNDVDYVYYLDSDDWFSDTNTLAKINDNLGADVLFVGVAADYNGIIRCFYAPKYKDQYEAILGWSRLLWYGGKKRISTEMFIPRGYFKRR